VRSRNTRFREAMTRHLVEAPEGWGVCACARARACVDTVYIYIFIYLTVIINSKSVSHVLV